LVGLENLGATCYINTLLQVCRDSVVLAHMHQACQLSSCSVMYRLATVWWRKIQELSSTFCRPIPAMFHHLMLRVFWHHI